MDACFQSKIEASFTQDITNENNNNKIDLKYLVTLSKQGLLIKYKASRVFLLFSWKLTKRDIKHTPNN